MKINDSTSLTDLFENAKSTVRELRIDEVFLVKDLFRGFEWNRIDKGNRTKLGSLFFSYANHDGAPYMDCVGKTPQNQQKYKKK